MTAEKQLAEQINKFVRSFIDLLAQNKRAKLTKSGELKTAGLFSKPLEIWVQVDTPGEVYEDFEQLTLQYLTIMIGGPRSGVGLLWQLNNQHTFYTEPAPGTNRYPGIERTLCDGTLNGETSTDEDYKWAHVMNEDTLKRAFVSKLREYGISVSADSVLH